jgi:hypothetical protein
MKKLHKQENKILNAYHNIFGLHYLLMNTHISHLKCSQKVQGLAATFVFQVYAAEEASDGSESRPTATFPVWDQST